MKVKADFSARVYKLLLSAYPCSFRRDYGYQMQQVFRDRYRDEARRNHRLAVAGYWLRTLLDLIPSAAREHSENLRKEHTMRRDIVSLVGCICIILIAFTLLSYGRTHEVSAILVFGRHCDDGDHRQSPRFRAHQDNAAGFIPYRLVVLPRCPRRTGNTSGPHRTAARAAVQIWSDPARLRSEFPVLGGTTLGVAALEPPARKI